MERVLLLMPYKGKQKRTLKMQKETIQKPVIANVGMTEIWMWSVPVSKEYIVNLQKSFLRRGLFFVWLTWCFAGRECTWVRRKIWDAVQAEEAEKLFETPIGLRLQYMQYFLQSEYQYHGDEKWLILCTTCIKGWEIVRLLYASGAYLAEIILYHSDIFSEELAQFQAENGIVISKTWDFDILPECALILDCGVNLGSQIRRLAGEVTYLDLEEDGVKKRRITRENAQIQYISLGNFLDRHFQNGL